jgi:transposase
MLRITLTAEQRQALEGLRRDTTLSPAERDRVEMLLLLDSGWSVSEIASHFHCCQATVRRLFHRFRPEELSSLRRHHPGPSQDQIRREQVSRALASLLSQERTWTSVQLAQALEGEGIFLSPRQARRYLRWMGAKWRRTKRSLRHKQDAERLAQAKEELAELKRGLRQGSSPWPTLMSAALLPVSR